MGRFEALFAIVSHALCPNYFPHQNFQHGRPSRNEAQRPARAK